MEDGVAAQLAEVGAALLRKEPGDVLSFDGGEVEALDVDVRDRGRGKHLKDPETTGAGADEVAKDGLVVAVHKTHVGGVGNGGELRGSLLEGVLGADAVMA